MALNRCHVLRAWCTFGTFVLLACGVWVSADDKKNPPQGSGFRAVVEKHQRETLKAVVDYVAQNADAADLEEAHAWMFETAIANGLEAEVVPAAEAFLKKRGLDQPVLALGQQALCLGLAKAGKLSDATTVFDSYLRGARFQSPFKTLDVAGALAAQARMAGDLAASRAIYERVSATYALQSQIGEQIGEIVEGRIARQELIGKPAPRFGASDLEGKPVEASDYAGKVLLVDFWATNCAPCLAEFPNLKQLYKEYRERGFEIIGVSFDDSPELVAAFRTRAQLTWRMVMNESPAGIVSEQFKTRTIPALFLIDRQGKVAQVDVRGRDLRTVVEKLLDQN